MLLHVRRALLSAALPFDSPSAVPVPARVPVLARVLPVLARVLPVLLLALSVSLAFELLLLLLSLLPYLEQL